MIKINLVREGRAVRGAGAAPVAAVPGAAVGGRGINTVLLIGLLIVGVVVAAGYWWYTSHELSKREDTVRQRKAEAEKLETIIKDVENYQKRKDSLQKRIDLINQLKQNQKGPVRIMDRISQDLPDLVWLDRMSVSGGRISLAGRGLNPNAIANFVENIKNDPYFEEPEVGAMNLVSATPLVYAFDMSFPFTYTPKAPGGAARAGGAKATGTAAPSTAAPGGKK